jgi:DtxR family Mn-dependent transcriptional regulator
MTAKQTANMEDYLEAILRIEEEEEVARVSQISEMLGVKKPSVTAALGKLSEQGLVKHEKYGYVDLTPKGKKMARDVYRRHQLLTTFLHDIVGVNKVTAEDDACKMEHHLSRETTEKLSSLVEFISSGPRSEQWIENLAYFHEYGERSEACSSRCEEEE